MAAELPASEATKHAARAVIEQAGAALAARRSDIPATFVAQLFARAVPDDVVRYARGRSRRRSPSAPSIFSKTASRARRKSAARR